MTERERLIELLKNDSCQSPMLCDPNCKYASLKRCYEERTADYLLENGVIVPPYKVGDTVYLVDKSTELLTGKVHKISAYQNLTMWIQVWYTNGLILNHIVKDFDDCLFHTREAAEKALKERE